MCKMKLLTVIGTRPQYIKSVSVSKCLRLQEGLEEILVDTGQHFDYEMSEVFVRELGLPRPNYNLGVNSVSHGHMTARMLAGIEDILIAEKPDGVLVYGDTNSTLAAALAAVKLCLPVAHVEAGVRTHIENPEEINRKLVDHVSTLLFCATPRGLESLARENIHDGVLYTGDVLYDMMRVSSEVAPRASTIMEALSIQPKSYVLVTIHRQENTSEASQMSRIRDYIVDQAAGRRIVFPAHPRTVKFCASQGIGLAPIEVTKPVGYFDMYTLLANAEEIFTDSGGLQKEAYFHRVPCTTIDRNSAWPETVEAGWNRVWTSSTWRARKEIPDFGSGDAAVHIVRALIETFGR
jgi:UDP-GlcNAc3NAcA epimerase